VTLLVMRVPCNLHEASGRPVQGLRPYLDWDQRLGPIPSIAEIRSAEIIRVREFSATLPAEPLQP
jgi:hypothetical protein